MIVSSHSTNVRVSDVNEIEFKALQASKNYMELGPRTEVGYCAS